MSARVGLAPILCLLLLVSGGLFAQETRRSMTIEDVLRFRAIEDLATSEDGRWAAYAAVPDRGESTGHVTAISGERRYEVARGRAPQFGHDGAHVAFRVAAPFGAKDEAARPGARLIRLDGTKSASFGDVSAFGFAAGGAWFWRLHPNRAAEGEKAPKHKDSRFVLHRLSDGREIELENVTSALGHAEGGLVAAVIRVVAETASGEEGGAGQEKAEDDEVPDRFELQVLDLGRGNAATFEARARGSKITSLAMNDDGSRLAYLVRSNAETEPRLETFGSQEAGAIVRVTAEDLGEAWYLPEDPALSFSDDGRWLRFGVRTIERKGPIWNDAARKSDAKKDVTDPYDLDAILAERTVDVWHWRDPFVKTQERKRWRNERRRRWQAVHDLDAGTTRVLASRDVPSVMLARRGSGAVGYRTAPYEREITWDGSYRDVFHIDAATGRVQEVARRVGSTAPLGPDGRHMVWWDGGHWHAFDSAIGVKRNLTEPIGRSFVDEDHDYPRAISGFRVGGWVETSSGLAVLLQDHHDVWQVPLERGDPICLTGSEGRANNRRYRVVADDPERVTYTGSDAILLSVEDRTTKTMGFAQVRPGVVGVQVLLDGPFRASFAARRGDQVFFTRQSYERFPDLEVAGANFENPKRLTDVNPQMAEFAWGKARLVSWTNTDGVPMQGALIEPEGPRPEAGWPTLVYYYRFFSQRRHEFNQPRINHRPCFPYYASHGYAVFLPDIRFEVGRPGEAAVNCLVPGVQHLFNEGIADPKRIALHGHSWSGYQTAYVITQTDLFTCAIAGAPVSNMTSAYGGIRYGTGMARQFQYEKTQSRLGATLWERRDLYIDNSPLFYVDRVSTPLLIQFGDIDDAVPWTQGVELYLAFRRLDKNCHFLQYHDEPHHLKQWGNKLDYAIKMKEYIDHHLKGTPPAAWIKDGVPFRGDR